jgi:hypothetical protein
MIDKSTITESELRAVFDRSDLSDRMTFERAMLCEFLVVSLTHEAIAARKRMTGDLCQIARRAQAAPINYQLHEDAA